MKDGNKNYAEIIDDLQLDFDATTSGTNMRDSNMSNKMQLRPSKYSYKKSLMAVMTNGISTVAYIQVFSQYSKPHTKCLSSTI